jgi:SAM-dependent methyltransferase
MARFTPDRHSKASNLMSLISGRACPVCGTPADQARLFLKENIDPEKLSAFSFASRKPPEFMCHQLVQCQTCDLVFANVPPEQAVLAQAYHVSDFDSNDEANDAAEAYIRVIRPLLHRLGQCEAALEIGTGTGVFLELLQAEGFTHLVGVEPSLSAIAAAPPHRRAWIKMGIFQEEDFQPATFDLICCFMTMEHVRDPQAIASAAKRLLRPGGCLVLITHDYRSFVNSVLGKRSPIIDIEHLQLFSRASAMQLLMGSGFQDISISSFSNRYALQYWIRLLPVPHVLKLILMRCLRIFGLVRLKMSFNVGNIVSSGFLPHK